MLICGVPSPAQGSRWIHRSYLFVRSTTDDMAAGRDTIDLLVSGLQPNAVIYGDA